MLIALLYFTVAVTTWPVLSWVILRNTKKNYRLNAHTTTDRVWSVTLGGAAASAWPVTVPGFIVFGLLKRLDK